MYDKQLIKHSLIWIEFIRDSINFSQQHLYDLIRNQLLLVFDSPFVRISAINKKGRKVLSCNLIPEESQDINFAIKPSNDQKIFNINHKLAKKILILCINKNKSEDILFEICLNKSISNPTIKLLKSELQSFFKKMTYLKPITIIDYGIDIQKSELLRVTLSEISKQIRNLASQVFPADKEILSGIFSILYILPKYENNELKILSYIFNEEQLTKLASINMDVSKFEVEVSKDSNDGIAPYVAKTKAPIFIHNWYLDYRIQHPDYRKKFDLEKEKQLLDKKDLMQIPIVIGNKLQLIVQINGDLAKHIMFKWWVEKRCFELSHSLVLVNLLNKKLDLIISPLLPVEYNVVAYGKNTGKPPFAKAIKKSLSVLFLDIKNSSRIYDVFHSISDVVTLINKLFELFYKTIINHGGTIDKFLGDGILAIFGGYRDCPQKYYLSAVDAALEIKNSFETYVKTACQMFCKEKRWSRTIDLSLLSVRMGIATDNDTDTVVGEIGSQYRKEYTVIGGKVVIASRLISDIGKPLEKNNKIELDGVDIKYCLSKPSYILIDGDTYSSLGKRKYQTKLIYDKVPIRGFNKEIRYQVHELVTSND